MNKKLKVYLDTSVISALFDRRNPDRKKTTEEFFQNIDRFDIYISDITNDEIHSMPIERIRKKMERTVAEFTVLHLSEGVQALGEKYIAHGAVPATQRDDALHIAHAVMNDIEYLLSWNFKHLVRLITRDIVRMVNTIDGHSQIIILTPGEIL